MSNNFIIAWRFGLDPTFFLEIFTFCEFEGLGNEQRKCVGCGLCVTSFDIRQTKLLRF